MVRIFYATLQSLHLLVLGTGNEVVLQILGLHLLVLGTGNEVVLQILGEFREVGAVAGNADYEAPVLLGILLGVDEGLAVYDVELHMPQP